MTATCALPGCADPVRNGRAAYCSDEHKRMERARQQQLARKRASASTEPKKRGRPFGGAETAQEIAIRQQLPRTYRLRNDPRAAFRPPIAVVRQPAPLPFTDDLNAVLNHGSPGAMPARPTSGYASQCAGQ
jgi:hypothetical protein